MSNNKFLQRKTIDCYSSFGIKQPDFRLVDFWNVVGAFADLGYKPSIIKPVDGRGSIGVYKVRTTKEAEKYYLEALKYSPSRQVVLEEFIDGQVVSVEGLYADKFYNLTYSTKKMHPKHRQNAMELRFPGDLGDDVVERLYSINEIIASAMHVDFGLMHSEYIITKHNEIYFLEATNRGGGVHIANKIVPEVTGVDTCRFLINSAFDKDTKINIKQKKHCFLHFFDFGTGVVSEIKTYKDAFDIEGVIDFRLNFNVKDKLETIETAVKRPGFVIVSGNSAKECEKTIKEVEKSIEVIFC